MNGVAAGLGRVVLGGLGLLGGSVLLGACTGFEEVAREFAARRDPSTQPVEQQAPSREYRPPAPSDEEDDWVCLVSGEWLRGKIIVLRDESLDFDSKELDELTIDWDKVVQLRSARRMTLRTADGTVLVGTLLMRDGVLRVAADLGDGEAPIEHAFIQNRVLALISGDHLDDGYWTGKVTIGLTGRQGNTTQTDVSSNMLVRRETPATRAETTYTGAFSRVEGVEAANNHRVRTRFDWYLTERFFVTPLAVDLFRDPFQNIEWRFTPSAGIGYTFAKSKDLEVSVTTGPALQRTAFVSVEAGQSRVVSTGAVTFSPRVAWDVTPDIDVTSTYEITAPVPDVNAFTHHFETILGIDITGDLNLDIQFIWDRVNQPPPDETGVTPLKDDFRMYLGLGYEF